MNPFANATIFGYKPDEILNFLKKASPQMAEKVQKAMALGYSTEEIVKFLGKSFDGSTPKDKQKGPDYESAMRIMQSSAPSSMQQAKAERESKEQDVLSTVLTRGAPAAIGAGIGGLVGGPAGAMAGGAAGLKGTQELMNKYQEHVQTGGSLSLTDWLKSIMKGGAAGAAALQAPKLLAAIQAGGLGGGEAQQEPGGVEDVQAEVVAPESPQDLQQFGPQESYEVIKAQGQGADTVFQSLAKQLPPEEALSAMENLYGKQFTKQLEKQSGRPALEVITQAAEFVQASSPQGQQQQAQPTQTQPGIPTEASVEQDVLREMGVGQPPVQQAPPPTPTMPDERVTGRNVKQLDMGEGDESFLADVFHKTFEEPEYPTAKSEKKRQIAPLANAFKSSNVRGGQWNKDTGEMRIIFQPKEGSAEPGSVYTYPNVDQEAWEDLTGGKAIPITEGENIFGFWDRGKQKSIGAAFSKKIKKNEDKYPPTQLAEEDITVGENQIRSADRAFMVSDLFAPFKKQRADGRRVTKASELNEWVKDYADYSAEDTFTMIELVEEKLKDVLKNAPSKGRLKKELTSEFGVKFNPTEKEKEQLAKKAAREAAKKKRKR